MPTKVLLATDTPWTATGVSASLPAPEFELETVSSGETVLAAVLAADPALVVLDFQIGNMGAAAVAYDLRNEWESGRIQKVPLLLLLDREADVFLARRAGADAWILKPPAPGALLAEARKLAGADGAQG